MKAHDKAAIGIYISRGKEHLVAIRAYQHGLIMSQMFYDTEVRAFDNKCANIPVSPIEMALGKILIDTLSKPTFDSSKYSDKFIEKLNTAVAVKLANPEQKIGESETQLSLLNSMTDNLRASLILMGVPESSFDGLVVDAIISSVSSVEVPQVKPARKPRVKKAS